MGQVTSSEECAGEITTQEAITVRTGQKRAHSPDICCDDQVEFEANRKLIARAAKWGFHYRRLKTDLHVEYEKPAFHKPPAPAINNAATQVVPGTQSQRAIHQRAPVLRIKDERPGNPNGQPEEHAEVVTAHMHLWSTLLRGSSLVKSLAPMMRKPPTQNQKGIIGNLWEGSSVVAYGSYAVYVAATQSQCESFATELRKLDSLPKLLVIAGITPPETLQSLANGCDILCVHPSGLVSCMSRKLVSFLHTRLFVCDEANTMLDGQAWLHIMQAKGFTRKQQGAVVAPKLFVASSFDGAQKDKLTTKSKRRKSSSGETVVVEMCTESWPPESLGLSFAVVNDVARQKEFQHFMTRSVLVDHRPVVVLLPDAFNARPLENLLKSCPYIKLQTIEQGSTQDLQPNAADLLVSGLRNVFFIRLGEYNSGVFGASLSCYPGELNVCVFRMYKDAGGRSWFQKYHDIIARMGRIEQVKECFTMLTLEEHTKHSDQMRIWLESVGRDIPACLSTEPYTSACDCCTREPDG
ncbi:hypothetical protein LTR85_000093 [Meristemomyces frigidus]|nr:hypothetical protein LTR85_000093 [Meristemomyces frigidus]